MSFCKEELAFRLCCSRSIQDTKDSDGARPCSSLETGCQNIFMQEVVSLKTRFIDMGQHPTGSWVNESLICRDKMELYSLLVIWLPKEIHAFCLLETLSSLSLLKPKPDRQFHLQQLQCVWWRGASCRSRLGRCSSGLVQRGIDRKGLTQLSQMEITPFSTGWWFREGREVTDLCVFPFITSVVIPMVFACQFP